LLLCPAFFRDRPTQAIGNADEIAKGKTQPPLADSHGGDKQKWEIADWGYETSSSPYYRFINVHNGYDY
jgi:hypothetical protein